MATIYRFIAPYVAIEILEVDATSEEEARAKLGRDYEKHIVGSDVLTWSPEQWEKEFGALTGTPALVYPVPVTPKQMEDAWRRACVLWGELNENA